MLSIPDMALLGVLALLVFGEDKLPGLMRQAGRVMREVQGTSEAFLREMEHAADTTERPKPTIPVPPEPPFPMPPEPTMPEPPMPMPTMEAEPPMQPEPPMPVPPVPMPPMQAEPGVHKAEGT